MKHDRAPFKCQADNADACRRESTTLMDCHLTFAPTGECRRCLCRRRRRRGRGTGAARAAGHPQGRTSAAGFAARARQSICLFYCTVPTGLDMFAPLFLQPHLQSTLPTETAGSVHMLLKQQIERCMCRSIGLHMGLPDMPDLAVTLASSGPGGFPISAGLPPLAKVPAAPIPAGITAGKYVAPPFPPAAPTGRR